MVNFNDIFQEMWNEKIKQNSTLSQKYYNSYKRAILLFFQLFNTENMEDITRDNCNTFVNNYLFRIPKNIFKIANYKCLSADELLLAENEEAELSTRVLVDFVLSVKNLFQYAYLHGFIKNDYSLSLKTPTRTKKEKSEGISVFSSEEIKTIIKNLPSANIKPTDFFIPLIALFSGIMLNNICSLTVDNIVKDDGIYYFSITTNKENRKVPIHNMLIKLGFLDYFEYRKADVNCNRLFPDLFCIGTNDWTNAYGKRFKRLLDNANIKECKKPLNSLIYTFRYQAQKCGVSEDCINTICGVASSNSYDVNRNISVLNEKIQQIEYIELKEIFNQLNGWKY